MGNFKTLLLALTVLVYGNTVFNGFVRDDHAFIENQDHSSIPTLSVVVNGTYPVANTGSYRPVRNAVYAMTLPIFKQNPSVYHAFVVGLHLTITLMLYSMLQKIITNQTVVVGSTLMFLLHPIHSESINWITAGYDLVSAVFFLATVQAFYTYRQGNERMLLASFALAFCAIFSSEIASTLPLLLVIIDIFWFKKSILDAQNWRTHATLFGIGSLYWIIRLGLIGFDSFQTRVYQDQISEASLGVFLLGKYIIQLFYPHPLAIDHFLYPGLTGLFAQNHNLLLPAPPLPLSIGVGKWGIVVAIGWLSVLTILTIKKNKLAVPLWWVILSLLAVMRVAPLPIVYAERYAYIASIGFVIGVAMSIDFLSKKGERKINYLLKGSFASLAIIYALYSRAENLNWRNDETLWQKASQLNPESAGSISALGVVAYNKGNVEESYLLHQKSITMNPFVSSYQQNYINVLVKLEKFNEMVDFLTLLLKNDSQNPNLYELRAMAKDKLGIYQDAMADYQKAFDLLPVGSSQRQRLREIVKDLDLRYKMVDPE